MATVYLAIQEKFEREVALKVMSAALAEDKEFSARFLREARIVSQLVHPNIVTVHDVGIDNGHHFLSMEFIDGQELKQRLPDMSAQQIINVLRDLAKALDYAGSKGYVHRDVKPENIMLHNLDDRAVLMDFGIARATDASHTMTQTGVALGTPYYMSPEQARGKPIDSRSDLYSLGVLFYYMLTGEVPFDAESSIAIGIKHISEAVPRLPIELAGFQRVVDKLMAKNPGKRYQTGAELLGDFGKLDADVLASWKAGTAVVYRGSRQQTPIRNDSAADDNTEVDLSLVPKGLENVPPIDTSADKTNPFLNGSSAIKPDEALHIPEEDLRARAVADSGRGWLLIVVLLLISGLSAATFYRSYWLPAVPEALSEQLPSQILDFAVELDKSLPAALALEAVSELPVTQAATRGGTASPLLEQASAAGQSGDEQAITADAEIQSLLSRAADAETDWLQQLDLYRQVLVLRPDHQPSLQALATIQAEQLAVLEGQLLDGDFVAVEDGLNQLAISFPGIETEDAFTTIRQQLDKDTEIALLLLKGGELLAADKLLYPVTDNAHQRYRDVLALDPANADALAGLDNIVLRYRALANYALNAGDLTKARTRLANGLKVQSNNASLLALRQQIDAEQERQDTIKELLAAANSFEQQGKWYGAGDTAAKRYQQVLGLQADQADAQQGLRLLQNNSYAKVRGLIREKDYEDAGTEIQSALLSFPEDDRLLSLLLELESYKPVVEKILISGESFAALEGSKGQRLRVDRTLYIGFYYRNLDRPTSVLQVLLFDGTRSSKIAATPVVVTGRDGAKQFRIDRPVAGFPRGRYHLDVLLGGKRIATHTFVISH